MKIDDAIAKIDLAGISKAMRILGWTYVFSDTSPTVDELADTIRELSSDLTPKMNEEVSASTGGFTVSKKVYEDQPDLYLVTFSISKSVIIGDEK